MSIGKPPGMSEADTRAELIDPQLEKAGWRSDNSRIRREFTISPGTIKANSMRDRSTRAIADYVLEYQGRKLAVIEAKKCSLSVHDGVPQAKKYAEKLQARHAFASNGRDIYYIDMHTGKEKPLKEFPTLDALVDGTFSQQNEWLTKFNQTPFARDGRGNNPRYYQENAINKALEAVAEDKDRILLTLATGTGKTFIASQIVWKLFETRWTLKKDAARRPRILFLADRNLLANQAMLAFSHFRDDALVRIDPKDISKKGEVPKNGSIFFTIYQTFMSGPEDKPYFTNYDPDFFDFIIIDECHRGGARDESRWRGILKHFAPAVQLGLTATPRRDENGDTYNYFGEPVYSYKLVDGIQDGFLTPFRIKHITTTLDTYAYAADDDVVDGMIDEERLYEESDFNKRIEIEARERKRVRLMLTHMSDPYGKTIIFCANQAHAAMVRDLIRQEAPNRPRDYCVRITANDGAIGDNNFKFFKDNEKQLPAIVTTSQKLSTGVDVPDLRNIVIMRKIGSMIEFKQIIGRGTRVADNKGYFTIIDFVDASGHFHDSEWDGDPQEPVVRISEDDLPPDDTDPPNGGGDAPRDDDGDSDGDGGEPEPMIKVKLADGKVREISSSVQTSFMIDGKPVTASEYLKWLFSIIKTNELFQNEEELRKIWSHPNTRSELLKKLAELGCDDEHLHNLQKLISAENSDLFDVLEFVAYSRSPITRRARIEAAESNIYTMLNDKQREFIKFVMANYEREGVSELDAQQFHKIIESKYETIQSGENELGDLNEARAIFIDCQKHLYVTDTAA